jgi:glycosyltransferase involved in cell wall biosynthesis
MADSSLRLLVIGNLPPHVLGGAENQISRLTEAWILAGANIEIAGHRIPDGEQAIGAARVRTHRIRTWNLCGRAGLGLSYLLSISSLVLTRRRDFDVVYCRGIGDGVLSLAILKTLGLCRWPIIAVPINARGAGDVAFLQSIPGWRILARLIDRQINCIILINDNIAADLDSAGIVRAERHHIPNGIPVLPAIQRDAVGQIRRLVWTGRLEHQKGLDLLLHALAHCRRAGASFRLLLLGEGPLVPELSAQADELGLTDIVEFAGAVPADSIRARLASADVFILPSRYEGMSNAALEAMEAGLPVLCTQCGGIDLVIADVAGWVCIPDNQAALLNLYAKCLMPQT